MKKQINILQNSLEIAVILLLVVTMVGAFANQKLMNGKMVSNTSEEEVEPGYLKFPNKPYTQALYENQEEKDKWPDSVILEKSRVLEIEGHPFTGNTNYKPLVDPIQVVQGEITYSPFDFTQKVDLYVRLPGEKKTVCYTNSYEPISLDEDDIAEKLSNHLLCFRLHLPDLYNNATFPFSPYNIVLLDSDGKTPLPYWVQDDHNKEMLVWTRLPVYYTAIPKPLYIVVNENLEYPIIDSSYAFSNFDSVFTKQDANITGQYQFRLNKLGTFQDVLDLSGNHNSGKISKLSWGENLWGPSGNWDCEYKKIFFSEDVYCSIPNNNQSVLSLQNGSMEMIIDYRGAELGNHGNDGYWFTRTGFSDSKAIFFEDTNKNFSLYYFKGALYWNFVKNHQLMQMQIPLSEQFLSVRHPVFQIFCSWNQSSNQYDFYLDGKKQEHDQIIVLSKAKSNEFGDLIIGESSDSSSFSYSFIPSVFFYDKSLDSTNVARLIEKHWHLQNPLLVSVLESFRETLERETPDFKNIESGDTFFYDLLYVAPTHNDFNRGNFQGASIDGREVSVLFKENDDWQPVFGFHNHFYSYVGTYIESKKPCMVEYVKLSLVNPEFIKELRIEFLYTSHTVFSKEDTKSVTFGKLFNWLELAWGKIVPSAEACGPFYSHKEYGNTLLELVSSEEDLYTYRLEEPIYIDENADFMQIEYKNNNKLGRFSLKLEDIYVYSDDKYSKGIYAPDMIMKYSYPYVKEWNDENQTFDINIYGDSFMSLYPDFQILLLGQEKGFLQVEVQNQGSELAFVFKNEGSDSIIITKESLLAIQSDYGDDKWVGLQFVPVVKYSHDVLNSIEIDLPFNSLLGKIIKPGESITLPFFQWKKYSRKEGFKNADSVMIYKATVEGKTSTLPLISLKKMKIIQWSDKIWNHRGYGSSGVSFEINILPDDKIEMAE